MTARIALILLTSLGMASAELIQLKDNASVRGKILTEKPDQVFVDLGFTVLGIPRSEIVKIAAERSATNSTAATGAPTPSEVSGGIFATYRTPPPEKPVRELVNELGAAVVQVRTPAGLGSGFVINEDGYLITNFHVIEGETQITVEVYHQQGRQMDRHVYRQVRIVAMNKFHDLALLKIEDDDAPKFPIVHLGNSDDLAVGDHVFAIGSPLGLERTVTEGIVSTKTREVAGNLYLQTTAQINPGNSGGPLFNLHGEVVGVTNMKLLSGEGIGFAIPVEGVRYFLKNRDAFAYDNDNPSNPYRYLEPPTRLQQMQEKAKQVKESH